MGRPRSIKAEHIRETQAETARAAGVSRQAVHKSKVIAKLGAGMIDVPVAVEELERTENAERRKEIALADLRELERDEKRRLLVRKDEVTAQWSDIATRFRDGLLSLGTRVVTQLPDEWRREVSRVVEQEARKVLKSLSDEFRPSV